MANDVKRTLGTRFAFERNGIKLFPLMHKYMVLLIVAINETMKQWLSNKYETLQEYSSIPELSSGR